MDLSARKLFTIPNVVSLSRIALVPFIAHFMSLGTISGTLWATGLIALALFTDFLDGFLARILNQRSDLGRMMDPFADKLFIIWFVVVLINQRDFPLWLAVLYIVKDLVIMVSSYVIMSKEEVVSESNLWGKYAFGFQASVVVSYFFNFPFGIWSGTWISVILIVPTLISYGNTYFSIRRGARPFRFKIPRVASVESMLRIAAAGVYAVLFFSHIYCWTFENNSVVTDPSLQFESPENSQELLQQYAPIFVFGESAELPQNAGSYYLTADSYQGIRHLWGLLDHQTDDIHSETYLKHADQFETSPVIYARALEVNDPEQKVRFVLQYWAFFLQELEPNLRKGDWEMFSVYLDADYQQVESLVLGCWNATASTSSYQKGGEIYVGNRSNNFYFYSGRNDYSVDNESLVNVGDEVAGGPVRLSSSDYQLEIITGDEEFIRFPGGWGGPMPFGDRGPAYWNAKKQELSPWNHPLLFLRTYR